MTFQAAQAEIARLTLEAAKYNAAADRAQRQADNAETLYGKQCYTYDAQDYRRTAERFIARADAIVDSVACPA